MEYIDSVISLDLLTPDASCRGEAIHMRPTEFRLLSYLAFNNDRILSHQELLDHVWGAQGGSLDSLKWHISALRDKLETDSKKQMDIVIALQKRAYEYVPYVSYGQWQAPFAFRKALKGMMITPNVTFWRVSK